MFWILTRVTRNLNNIEMLRMLPENNLKSLTRKCMHITVHTGHLQPAMDSNLGIQAIYYY